MLAALLLLAPGGASAWPEKSASEHAPDRAHPSTPGIDDNCSLAYYDICSGWIWVWSGGGSVEENGVVFDLATDCGRTPGATCANTGFWWYWRYTAPGYGWTVTYRLYELDSSYCKTGAAVGVLANRDPVERWNHLEGLGATPGDFACIAGAIDNGTLPYLVTDNGVRNEAASCNPEPAEAHSVWYEGPGSGYCPQFPFYDESGPVNILMDADFSCSPTGTEETTWSSLKLLFR
jgi:hypothetical protein